MALTISTGAGAAPPSPPVAASTDVEVAKARVNAAIEAMNEISSSIGKIDRAAIRKGKTPLEMAAILEAQTVEAQVIADGGMRKLTAIQPVAGDDDLATMTNLVLRDARTFGGRVETVLADTRATAQALRTGDQAKIQKSLTAMSASAVVLIEGQATIMRARKAFCEPKDSNRDQLEAMATVYDGSTVILKAVLQLTPPVQAAASIRDARDRVLVAVAGGRAKMRAELAAAAKMRGQERKTFERTNAYQARIFDSLVESAAILGRTADQLESGDAAGVRTQIDALRAEESNQQDLIAEQLNQ
jgi:hypothetical protein